MAKNIRDLSRPLDYSAEDALAALDEAATGSPRITAIVAAAVVEDALRWCLCGFLIPAGAKQAELPADEQEEVFDGQVAPLHTFHAKIVIACSLGIYGKVTRDNLKSIKNIRNAFAHSPRAITFDTPEIAVHCLKLRYDFFADADDSSPINAEKTDLRRHFLEVAKILTIHLHAAGFPGSEYAKTMGKMR